MSLFIAVFVLQPDVIGIYTKVATKIFLRLRNQSIDTEMINIKSKHRKDHANISSGRYALTGDQSVIRTCC